MRYFYSTINIHPKNLFALIIFSFGSIKAFLDDIDGVDCREEPISINNASAGDTYPLTREFPITSYCLVSS